jgi:hypothetical protein
VNAGTRSPKRSFCSIPDYVIGPGLSGKGFPASRRCRDLGSPLRQALASGKDCGRDDIVDLKTEEFPQVGERVDVVGATPAPTLIYQRREHQIALN